MAQNVSSLSEIAFYYPNGTDVSFLLTNEKSDLSNNVLTITMKNPQSGTWKLQKKSAYSWVINVTAQSAFDFTVNILETNNNGNSYQLSGNPIKGNNYSIAVDIENFNPNSTCTSVALLDESGNDVMEIFVTRVYLMEIARYIGDFIPYNRSSYVQIRGTDDEGNPFLRTRSLYIMPVSIQLRISPLLRDLRLHESSNISFSLTNTGESLLDFVITISGGFSDVIVQRGSLDGGAVYDGEVAITPTSLKTITLHIFVTLENYTGIIQTEKRRYFVTDSRTAHCTVTEYPRMCPAESRNTVDCSSYEWNGTVQVSSVTIKESVIKTSSSEVVLSHMNLTDANFSVPILISGHCCIQTVVLSIIDKDGFFDQCKFILSKQPLTIVQYPTTTEDLTTVHEITSHPVTNEGNSKVIGISIGIVILGVILIPLIVFIVHRVKVRFRRKTPVELSNYRTLRIVDDGTPGIEENLDTGISSSKNVLDCGKKKFQSAEKQKSPAESSDDLDEENDTNSEAQKLMSQKKDPEKSLQTRAVSESSVSHNLQMDKGDDEEVISDGSAHEETHGTGIL